MDRLKAFHDRHVVLRPNADSFTAEGEASRWSNKDLDPVPTSRRTWEWWHVGGFWIAEGFNAAQMQVPSSAVSLGLNPGLALVACLIGNLLVTPPLCVMSYIGAKVRFASSSYSLGHVSNLQPVWYQLSSHFSRVCSGTPCFVH